MPMIFISHVEEDQQAAFDLAAGLEHEGYKTWLYERDGIPGAPYLQVVLEAVMAAAAMVVLISRDALGSEQVDREITMAFTRKPLLPVLRGVSHAEFEHRRPTWAAAFGMATSISLANDGCEATVAGLVRGLEWQRIIPAAEQPPTAPVPVELTDTLAAPVSAPDPQPARRAALATSVPGRAVGEEATGPDGGTYVWVPPGEFMMGSEDGASDERPVHRVRLTRGFWLSKHQVTNARYADFCAETQRTFPAASNQGDDHPVACVRWEDAQAYCEHYGLALPTEAQWEHAARGPESREYPWGNEWDPKKCCNRDNIGPGGRTFPVGSFPSGASWCGALHMAGNVREWCADWFAEDWYSRSPAGDPGGPADGKYRVVRGGGWLTGAAGCCAANRSRYSPVERDDQLGFRPVVAPR